MDTIKIKVRKEVIRCDKCKTEKEFLYLSDFAYGERLIFFDSSSKCAYINLIEDEIYSNYIRNVKAVLQQKKVDYSQKKISDIINKTFGMTCDEVDSTIVDFTCEQEKCLYCGSDKFERNMVKPYSVIEIEVPVISHEKWEKLLEGEQRMFIENELKNIE